MGEQGSVYDLAMSKVREAMARKGITIKVQTLTLNEARRDDYSFYDVIEWLLASHIHFVITHPHQGIYLFMFVNLLYRNKLL